MNSQVIQSKENDIINHGYYRGWTVQYNKTMKRYESPSLCLYFGFKTRVDIERAIDAAIIRRERENNQFVSK